MGRHEQYLSNDLGCCPMAPPPSQVSLFMGLRLVFTVVMTKPILGASIIQTGVQVRHCLAQLLRLAACPTPWTHLLAPGCGIGFPLAAAC